MVIAITIVMPCLLLLGHLLHSQVELDLKRSRLVGRSGSAMMLCYEHVFLAFVAWVALPLPVYRGWMNSRVNNPHWKPSSINKPQLSFVIRTGLSPIFRHFST